MCYCVECCGRHTQAMRKVLGCLGICSQSGLGSGLGRRGLGPQSASKSVRSLTDLLCEMLSRYWTQMAVMD